MKLRAQGYIKQLNFSGLRQNGKLNPLVLVNNNNNKQLVQKQAAKTALEELLTEEKQVHRWFADLREIQIFYWLKQTQRLGRKTRGSTKILHKQYLSYSAANPEWHMCLRYFEQFLRDMSTRGIITRFQEKSSDGYQQFTYYIDFPAILNSVPNFNQQWSKIMSETGDFSQLGKVCQININRYVIYNADNNNSVVTVERNYDQEWYDFLTEQFNQQKIKNFNRKKKNFPPKERYKINEDWQPSEEIIKQIKYTYQQISDYYIQAAVTCFKKYNTTKDTTSDDWNLKFKRFVFIAFRKEWRTIQWLAWKLQKDDNQDKCNAADTQPEVVITEQYERLKAAISTSEDRRRSMANILLCGTTLHEGVVNVVINANTAQEWAQYLPTIKEFMKDICYKSFAGVQSIAFVER